jgi:predicted PurR-regulated permease PerM
MSLPPPSARQSSVIWLAFTGLAVATILALLIGTVWGMGVALNLLAPVLWPLAVAGVLAYLLDPVVDFFERKGVPRTRAIVLVFVIAIGLFLGLLSSVLPQVISESRDLATKVPTYAEKVWHRADAWLRNPPEFVRRYLGTLAHEEARPTNTVHIVTSTNLSPAINPASATTNAAPAIASTNDFSIWSVLLGKVDKAAVAGWLTRSGSAVGSWIVGQMARVASIFGLLAGLALVPVYAFYFLLEKQGIEKSWTDYLPLSNSAMKDELVFVLRSINDCLIAFFRSQVLVAICDGVLYTIGFLVIGLPYAVLLGVMATFLTMIPFLGAMATCAAALVIAFAQYTDWQHPAGVMAVFAVVQTLEGFVIQPKIMGDRIGLHPLTVIIALMVGTTLLGGILGGILAIPLTAAGRVVMFRYVWKKRDEPAVA